MNTTTELQQVAGVKSKLNVKVFDANSWLIIESVKPQFKKTKQQGQAWTSSASKELPDEAAIVKISFTNEISGWALTNLSECKSFKTQCSSQTKLFSTADSGQSWTEVIL